MNTDHTTPQPSTTDLALVPVTPAPEMLTVLDSNVGDTIVDGRALAAGVWRDMLAIAEQLAGKRAVAHPTIARMRDLGQLMVSLPDSRSISEIEEAGSILLAIVHRPTELLVWNPASQPPDDATTVLLELIGHSEPVWIGYRDPEGWMSAEGDPLTDAEVRAWAHMPAGGASC